MRRNASGNPVKSVEHTLAGVRSILRSLPGRVELGEVNEPDLAALNGLHETVERVLWDCVDLMRSEVDEYGRPVTTWAMIGAALGCSKQAAFQRWERHAAARS